MRARGYGFGTNAEGRTFLVPGRVVVGKPSPMTGETVWARVVGEEVAEVQRQTPAVLKTGTVSWYDPARGYGYISDGSASYYLHGSELLVPGQVPQRGDLVTFWTPGTGKGDRASFAVITP